MRDPDQLSYPRIGSREELYKNSYQQVYRVRVDFRKFTKEIFVTDHGHRAGVIAEGPKGILLTRQYRYLIDRYSHEIPGGKVELGESLLAAARRECLEETGILCHELRPLLMFHPGLDTLHNPSHLFYTCDLEVKGNRYTLHGDEVSGREWIPLDQCIAMISSQAIIDGFSVVALLSYNTFIKQR